MIHDDFPEPEQVQSQNGELSLTLTAQKSETTIDGKPYVSHVYNGQFPGPTMVACPGDTLNVLLQNRLVASDFLTGEHPGHTNLHTHGFHVSPHVPQDNVFRDLPPGADFQYSYQLPLDHPPGAYWYHPHLHGQTNPQTYAGMAGAIVIQGGLDDDPDYANIGTRELVIQQTSLGNGETLPPGQGTPQLFVNGALNPEIDIAPGELQRWRIYNATSGDFVKVQLQGHAFRLLARDGNYLPRIKRMQVMTIPPASRREVIVRGGANGSYELLSLPFMPTPTVTNPQQTLATVVSGGDRDNGDMPPRRIEQLTDLRGEPVGSHHKLVYTQDPPNFYINGKQFDPDVIDQEMTLNEIATWKIENSTTFWHTFHIHINDFQLTKVNGEPVRGVNNNDNVSIPPGGSVTMRYLPTDYTGKFVFHCHVLGHEDNGMMGTVRVTK
jgi:FtsP/CotA-like multicopper oxidase with cupredoxin domain